MCMSEKGEEGDVGQCMVLQRITKIVRKRGVFVLVNLLSEIRATRVQSTWRLLRRYALQIIKQYDATAETR